jgi:hypothetical protein
MLVERIEPCEAAEGTSARGLGSGPQALDD